MCVCWPNVTHSPRGRISGSGSLECKDCEIQFFIKHSYSKAGYPRVTAACVKFEHTVYLITTKKKKSMHRIHMYFDCKTQRENELYQTNFRKGITLIGDNIGYKMYDRYKTNINM